MKRNFFYGVLLGIFLQNASANSNHHMGAWPGVDLTGPVVSGSRFIYDIMPQSRYNISTGQYLQTNANLGIAYRLRDNLSIWLGSLIIMPGTANGRNDVWSQIIWSPLNRDKVNFTTRSRLQQQKQFNHSDWALVFRERLTLILPTFFSREIRPLFFDETFIHIHSPAWANQKTFSQNRAFAGLRFGVSKSCNFDLGYLNQSLFRTHSTFVNHIIYFNLNFITS